MRILYHVLGFAIKPKYMTNTSGLSYISGVMMAFSVMETLTIEEINYQRAFLHNISAHDYHFPGYKETMKSFKFVLESVVLLYGFSDLMNFSDGSSRILFKLQLSSV